MVKLPVTDHT